MPDVPLPPVGELVQITTVDGWSAVGCRTGHLPWVHAVGRPPVKCEDIASWCPVLVLPDTDEIIEAMTAAAWQGDAERVRIDGPWSEQDGACRADWLSDIRAAWAAVRGAAIR